MRPGLYNISNEDGCGMLEDESVDVIMKDGPYFLTKAEEYRVGGDSQKTTAFGEWDIGSSPSIMRLGIQEDYRILKQTGSLIIWSSWQMLPEILAIAEESGFFLKRKLTWCKTKASPMFANMGFVHATEDAIWLTKNKAWTHYYHKGMESSNNYFIHAPVSEPGRFHPCEKPVSLYYDITKRLVKRNAGSVIVEPYAGSAPMYPVAQSLGCEYYGFELNSHYVNLATKRRGISNVL